jgi:hypothetical protein
VAVGAKQKVTIGSHFSAVTMQKDVDWATVQMWPGSADNLLAVQSILDRNKMIISEIDANHCHRNNDSLERNVDLIRELNLNINRVVGLYQELTEHFAKVSNGQTVEVGNNKIE